MEAALVQRGDAEPAMNANAVSTDRRDIVTSSSEGDLARKRQDMKAPDPSSTAADPTASPSSPAGAPIAEAVTPGSSPLSVAPARSRTEPIASRTQSTPPTSRIQPSTIASPESTASRTGTTAPSQTRSIKPGTVKSRISTYTVRDSARDHDWEYHQDTQSGKSASKSVSDGDHKTSPGPDKPGTDAPPKLPAASQSKPRHWDVVMPAGSSIGRGKTRGSLADASALSKSASVSPKGSEWPVSPGDIEGIEGMGPQGYGVSSTPMPRGMERVWMREGGSVMRVGGGGGGGAKSGKGRTDRTSEGMERRGRSSAEDVPPEVVEMGAEWSGSVRKGEDAKDDKEKVVAHEKNKTGVDDGGTVGTSPPPA